MSKNNLTNKLDRIDSAINTMREKLVMNSLASIEEIAEATDLKPLSNIFIQENEPQNKNGIWIQADKESHPWSKIKIDKNIIIPKSWRNDLAGPRIEGGSWKTMPITKTDNKCICVIGDKLFMINQRGPSNMIRHFWEYDLKTKKTTFQFDYWMTKANATDYSLAGDGERYIYFPDVHSGNIWIWDTQAKTLSSVATKAENTGTDTWWADAAYNPVDKLVYLYANGTSGKIAVFDPETKKTNDYIMSGCSAYQKVVPIGDHLVLVCCTKSNIGQKWYQYDLNMGSITAVETNIQDYKASLTDQILMLSDSFLKIRRNFSNVDSNIGCVISQVIKVDKNTLEAEDITAQFTNNELSYPNAILYWDNKYQALCGPWYGSALNTDGLYGVPMDCDTVQYDDNMIVIMQSKISCTEKNAAIWTYPPLIEGSFKQSFFDVYYYNKDTGFDFALPIYYGDGTKWVKFKN